MRVVSEPTAACGRRRSSSVSPLGASAVIRFETAASVGYVADSTHPVAGRRSTPIDADIRNYRFVFEVDTSAGGTEHPFR